MMTPNFKVTMVMRRNAEKAKDYAKRHKIPNYTTNALELIEDTAIDAIYIATPPDTHKFYALQVAAAGKPCCIEKPMAPSYVDSLEFIMLLARKNFRYLFHTIGVPSLGLIRLKNGWIPRR